MIFSPDLARKVVAGQKTVTRRRRRDGERCRYQEGRMYAVQPGRGKRSVARILVVSVRPEMIGTISQAEAEREGFRSVAEFVARWLSLYGSVAWTDPVWRIEFELVDGEGCAA